MPTDQERWTDSKENQVSTDKPSEDIEAKIGSL